MFLTNTDEHAIIWESFVMQYAFHMLAEQQPLVLFSYFFTDLYPIAHPALALLPHSYHLFHM